VSKNEIPLDAIDPDEVAWLSAGPALPAGGDWSYSIWHLQAIQFWLKFKTEDEDCDPAKAILMAMTGKAISKRVANPKTIPELCDAINDIKGWEPLTDEGKAEISLKAIAVYEESRATETDDEVPSLGGIIALVWANRLGYLTGAVALFYAKSWVAAVLAFFTFWAFGATRMAIQKQNYHGEHNPRETNAHIAIHVVCLIALFVVSGLAIYKAAS
jgi:hypothetical protein